MYGCSKAFLIVLIRKELPNSLLRFRPWLTTIPPNQLGPQPGRVWAFFIGQVVHKDIRYLPRKMRKGKVLSQTMKVKKKECAANSSISSKQKYFCQHQMVRSKNNCWLALFPKDVAKIMKTKLPVHIMVFRVITSDCDVMLSFFFPHGLRLNIEAYIKCLGVVLLIWIKKMAAGRSNVWQQDSAPYHTSRRSQSWLSEIFCNPITPNICLTCSADCNPLEYHVWGTIERDINKTLWNTKNELTEKTTADFTNLNKTVWKTCKRFQSRLEAVLEANGNFFE